MNALGNCHECGEMRPCSCPRSTPSEFELQILRTLNGEDVPGVVAGAAMWEAARSLRGMGYAQGTYDITEAGRSYLRNIDAVTGDS